MRDWLRILIAVAVLFLAILFVTTYGQAQGQRVQAWADAVKECESNGGAAVPRATAVLGRSADLPACVRLVGD